MIHSDPEGDQVRHSILDDCSSCGRTDAVVPSIDDQINSIVEWMDYGRIQAAMRGLGYTKIKTEAEMADFLRKELNDVVARVRKTCDQGQISATGGWYVWMDHGIINARWSVTERDGSRNRRNPDNGTTQKSTA